MRYFSLNVKITVYKNNRFCKRMEKPSITNKRFPEIVLNVLPESFNEYQFVLNALPKSLNGYDILVNGRQNRLNVLLESLNGYSVF